MIQIKDKEWDIIQNVEFLDYDMNYVIGYEQYKGSYIFALGYPYGDEIVTGTGKITNIKNNYEFEHNIPTDKGSSGSPIILLNISKVIKIIGVHKGESIKKMNAINIATFIGKIVDKIKTIRMKNYNELNKEKIDKSKKDKSNENKKYFKKEKDNYIIAEFDIQKNNVNKYIPIICSYENSKKYVLNESYNNKYTITYYSYNTFKIPDNELILGNEEEIKKCEIEIDEKKVPFSYKYLFNKEGKHIV